MTDRTKSRQAAGDTVWVVELYAAHPTGGGHGSKLLGALLPHLPQHVWLMASAPDPGLASLYRTRYGFAPWNPARPALLERTP